MTHIFGQVGHTHGPVDQRLSVAVAAFSNMDIIQSPEDEGLKLKGNMNMPFPSPARVPLILYLPMRGLIRTSSSASTRRSNHAERGS